MGVDRCTDYKVWRNCVYVHTMMPLTTDSLATSLDELVVKEQIHLTIQ
jgi:hypothetical protein